MNCTRCCGLMVTDHFVDHEGTAGYTWVRAWRCMNCGHVHDATIAHHRTASPAPIPARVFLGGWEDHKADEDVFLGAETIIPLAA